MSQENVEIVRRMLDQAQARPQALYDVLAEEVDWDASALETLELTTCHGRDAVMEFFRRWVSAFEEWNYEWDDLVDGGNSVIVRVHQWGRGKGSGAVVDDRFWQVWTLREGKVVRATHHRDRAQAFEAAGLSE